ncbi:ATP-binding protein [Desulfobacter curvatus]|uniref:ATP-binding protein n=1 Tax=Desulfobacter curvatus TaxID=2290 RepID=UPI000378CD66|nr:ATP-binding protein [Desulfobacter curvatus]
MKYHSITFKLLFFIVSAFVLTTFSVLALSDIQLRRTIDKSQESIYEEKIDGILGLLGSYHQRLEKTELVDVYEQDFKKKALENIAQVVQNQKDGVELLILDHEGNLVFSPRLPPGTPAPLAGISDRKILKSEQGSFDYKLNGVGYWCTFKRFAPWEWRIAYTLPLDYKYADAKTFFSFMLFIMVGISLTATILLSCVVAQFTYPITRLTDISARMAKGDLDQRINLGGKDEIGILAHSFELMRDSIKEKISRLSSLQNYLSNIIDSMPSVLIGVDGHGKVTQWNKTAEQATGIRAGTAQGQPLSDVLPKMASQMQQIFESIRTRKVHRKRKNPRPSENGIHYEDVTIYPLIDNGVEGAVIRLDDVTEKVRLEEMMVQSEKMLSVGGLAAGMAHEINNPLASMLQTANVMKSRLSMDSKIDANIRAAEQAGTSMEAIQAFMESRGIFRMIGTINQSGRRVADIVDNMLSFARKEESQISLNVVEHLLDKTLDLAATDYNLKKEYDFKLIRITKAYQAGDTPKVPCESSKIQQVLLNIFRNGAQAMQEFGQKEPEFIIRTWFQTKENQVCMEIRDNGPGMDEKIRKRVFEPFYTTKPVGVGTGLGLSVSYFIVKENHDGDIRVESSPGKGSAFIICLPVEKKP